LSQGGGLIISLLTFTKYDPEYAKAYREKQRAKREAQRAEGKVAPPPQPKVKPPPKVVQKPPVADAAVKLDRGEPLAAACTCATPPPLTSDVAWKNGDDFHDKPFAVGSNVRFKMGTDRFIFGHEQLKDVGIRDADIRDNIIKANNLFGERYGMRMSIAENVGTLFQLGARNKLDPTRVKAYIRDGTYLGLNPRQLKASALARDETVGWVAPGTGNLVGLLTHEFGHYFLDSWHGRVYYTGAQKQRVSMAAAQAARDAGAPPGALGSSVSRYAQTDKHEAEAELFAFYHMGGSKRPNWVIQWGETLHREMGLDPTPICIDLGVCP
jgi:hypothetical protein